MSVTHHVTRINAGDEVLALEVIRSELEADAGRSLVLERPCHVVAASMLQFLCVECFRGKETRQRTILPLA